MLSDELLPQSANRNIGRLADLRIELQEAVTSQLTDVDLVNTISLQCTPECNVTGNGEHLYQDGFHFTVAGARLLRRKLADSEQLSMFLK